MKLEEALKTNKRIARSSVLSGSCIRYFLPGTGPHNELVTCDYFLVWEFPDEEEPAFMTSIDLYPEDIFADDWEVVD